VPHQPVGCHADRLRAVTNIADHIRSQKRQFNQLLNAAFRNALGFSNLAEGFAGTNPIKIPMRTPDVAQQGFVDFHRLVADDELGFDPALAMLKGRRE